MHEAGAAADASSSAAAVVVAAAAAAAADLAADPPDPPAYVRVCRTLGSTSLAGEILETFDSVRWGRLYLCRYDAACVHPAGGRGDCLTWFALGEDACSELALEEDAVRLQEEAAGARAAPLSPEGAREAP